ncbi:hypothetical protein NQ016_02760 [Staphylococcus hyicus]|uniref:hypothetical protein n=1 Tax=Staphylococcus hyicus TaxID=1284 RepID=UPI00211C01CA|nr:hypothetical protein [Staphylococcus hyicus]MCQ9290440.1 hypothetical protein [Staphylococcus hyicus]MCQ9305682.1 hypothetical protein [Staphylococcus hyicus]MCQ9308094.1 hypothetical protein [Staphylococcus hyicus]MCQ9310516.1 hypothetical protein [Staphylococcus hyicus]
MKFKEALEKLKEQGFNPKEDKAIFRLEDGALEIYFDEDENKLITEIHDLKVFVSDDLNDREYMDVAFELSGIDEEDE